MNIFTQTKASAFSKIELLVVFTSVCVLAALATLYLRNSKTESHSGSCLANLKTLGTGMMLYREDNNDKLPIGYIHYNDKNFISWDSLIESNAQGKGDKSGQPAATFSLSAQTMLCPQDIIPPISWGTKPKRRSYSMPNYDTTKGNWPPSKNARTGVGLHWGLYAKGHDALTNLLSNSNNVPSVDGTMLLDPAGTLLLTEQVSYRNIMYNSSGSVIWNSSDHIKNDKEARKSQASLHEGRFNYLLIDGHVALLTPHQSVGLSAITNSNTAKNQNIWTIRADD